MTSTAASKLTAGQIKISIIIGCVVEAVFIALIASYPPDPPMDVYDGIILLSQAFAIIVGKVVLAPFNVAMTNVETLTSLFVVQAIFYIAVCILGFRLWNKKQAQGGNSISTDN